MWRRRPRCRRFVAASLPGAAFAWQRLRSTPHARICVESTFKGVIGRLPTACFRDCCLCVSRTCLHDQRSVSPLQWAQSQLLELKSHLEGLLEDRRTRLQAGIDALNERVAKLEAQFAEDKAQTMREIDARNRELTEKLEDFQVGVCRSQSPAHVHGRLCCVAAYA